MAHGAPAMSQAERHRLYLQNLQRRKQLEKEAEAMRNAHRDSAVALENGFQGFFNGANREVGKSLPSKHRAAPGRVESREKLLRVPGAVPVPSPFAHREAWADEGVQPPPRTARRRHEAQSEAPSERRVRRQWALGKAVLVRSSEGEMLQIDVPHWIGAAVAAA